MKRRKSNSIGILVTYLSDYIFPMIIRELEEEFTKEGFTVQLASSANSSKQEAELLQKMLENKVDGIILEPSRSAFPSPNVQMYQDLLKENFPLVSIHSKYDGLEIPTVAFDDKGAGYLAAEYLFELGHEKIGAILKADDKQGHKRYQGILQAHQEAGRTFDDKNVYWYTTEDIKNFAEAKEVILKRLETSSAVICYNDHIGIQYEKMLLEEGLHIPDTQSILSIDNSKYAELAPVAMTAVSSPIKEIGKFAAKSLIQQIRGEDFTKEKMFEPVLVKRGSTSFYRKGK